MKKFGNIIWGICLTLIIFNIIAVSQLSNLDEVWNFNIARSISNGLVPYKDISMVSTPLLGFLAAIPLKLFGQEMFYIRIFTVVLVLVCFLLIFKILKNLDVKKEISNFVVLNILVMIINFLWINYNLLSLIFILQIVLLEIKSTKDEKWKKLIVDFIIGISAGLTICSKQSTGLIVGIIVLLSPLFFIKSRDDVKKTIKKILVRMAGIAIPCAIFVIYLLANNAFKDFISYSVKGIKTFSNKAPYTNLLSSKYLVARLCSVIIPIVIIGSIITNIIQKIKKRENNLLYILSIYSIAMFFTAFPISDNEHFMIAIIPSLILIVYIIKELLRKFSKVDYKYLLEFINIFSFLTILLLTLWIEITNTEHLGNLSKYDYKKHFKYIDIENNLNASINEVDKYILSSEKNVYILDALAPLYMIPIDRYNKNYDMFCLGNLGAGGEEAIIEQIKNEDAYYLIVKEDEDTNWQNPTKVREYIKNNMELVGNVSGFEVYKNKIIESPTTDVVENIDGAQNNENAEAVVQQPEDVGVGQ